MSAAEPHVVFWEEDPTRTRVVKRGCLRCDPTQDFDLLSGYYIVSPSGIAHHAVDDHTACGIDATGPEWWWPL